MMVTMVGPAPGSHVVRRRSSGRLFVGGSHRSASGTRASFHFFNGPSRASPQLGPSRSTRSFPAADHAWNGQPPPSAESPSAVETEPTPHSATLARTPSSMPPVGSPVHGPISHGPPLVVGRRRAGAGLPRAVAPPVTGGAGGEGARGASPGRPARPWGSRAAGRAAGSRRAAGRAGPPGSSPTGSVHHVVQAAPRRAEPCRERRPGPRWRGRGPGRRSRHGSARRGAACTTWWTEPVGTTRAVRPNQLLAYSLPRGPLLDPAPVAALAGPLLTPLGCAASPPAPPVTGGATAAALRPQRDGALPPGHGVAVADRTVDRRLPPRRAADRRHARRAAGSPWPSGGWARCPRPPTATPRTPRRAARSRRGRRPRPCACSGTAPAEGTPGFARFANGGVPNARRARC